ncbi:hypothetical protein JZ785_15085 [Alicyclobacillus curvatus]|nr:hypothetical protein JZ785_15085 [Alicyclobacillus curvatus]
MRRNKEKARRETHKAMGAKPEQTPANMQSPADPLSRRAEISRTPMAVTRRDMSPTITSLGIEVKESVP